MTCEVTEHSDQQLASLEAGLGEVVTSCEFVDRAIEAASPTQLLLVRKQVTSGPRHLS